MSATIKLMIEITSDRSMLHSTFVVNFSMGVFPLAKALGAEGVKPSLFNAALLRRLRSLVLRSRKVQATEWKYPIADTQGHPYSVPLSLG